MPNTAVPFTTPVLSSCENGFTKLLLWTTLGSCVEARKEKKNVTSLSPFLVFTHYLTLEYDALTNYHAQYITTMVWGHHY